MRRYELPSSLEATVRPIYDLERAHQEYIADETALFMMREYVAKNPVTSNTEAAVASVAEDYLQTQRDASEESLKQSFKSVSYSKVRRKISHPSFEIAMRSCARELVGADDLEDKVSNKYGGVAFDLLPAQQELLIKLVKEHKAAHPTPSVNEQLREFDITLGLIQTLAKTSLKGLIGDQQSAGASPDDAQTTSDGQGRGPNLRYETPLDYARQQFKRLCETLSGGLTPEAKVVEALFPDEYAHDRRVAYTLFHELINEFAHRTDLNYRTSLGVNMGVQQASIKPIGNTGGLPVYERSMYTMRPLNDMHAPGAQRRLTGANATSIVCTWGVTFPARKEPKNGYTKAPEFLDTAELTGELIDMKVDEINSLRAEDANDLMRQHCIDVNQLISSEEIYLAEQKRHQLLSELYFAQGAVGSTPQSLEERVNKLIHGLSVFAPAITDRLQQVAEYRVARDRTYGQVPATDITRVRAVEVLDKVLAPLDLPIKNHAVVDELLVMQSADQYDEADRKVISVDQRKKLLEYRAALPMITSATPRERIVEYLSAFRGYPISKTDLTLLAFANGHTKQRSLEGQKNILVQMINPLQLAGRLTQPLLKEAGIYIQHGMAESVAGGERPKTVVRSVSMDDYDPRQHDGKFTDGTYRYNWRTIREHQD